MLVVYAGQLGNGKTLGMVAQALRIKQKRPDLPLYANFDIKGMSGRITSWKDLTSAKNCLICLDEGHILFDSRDFANNIKKTHFALQSRHVGLNIMITTQVLDQIDIRIRRIIDKLIICEKQKDRQGKVFFKYSTLTPSALTTNVFKIGRTEYLTKPELVWNKYDTTELIYDLSGAEKKNYEKIRKDYSATSWRFKEQGITEKKPVQLIDLLSTKRATLLGV